MKEKFIPLLIPIIIIGYIVFANITAETEITYTHQITKYAPFVEPSDRLIHTTNSIGEHQSEIAGSLIYFSVPVGRHPKNVTVKIKIKDEFPLRTKMTLGAKDKKEWHYLYKPIFEKKIQYDAYQRKGNVYQLSSDLPLRTTQELMEIERALIVSNTMQSELASVSNYINKTTSIPYSFRGKHEFIFYTEGKTDISVEKQDLNWYEGKDNLVLTVQDMQNTTRFLRVLEDDGIEEGNRERGEKRHEHFSVKLEAGTYKLIIEDFDGIVKNIEINTNKIVTDRIFFANNEIYGETEKQLSLYVANSRAVELTAPHKEGLQIVYQPQGTQYQIEKANKPILVFDEQALIFEKGDVIIEGADYFSFSEDNYFNPYKRRIISDKSEQWKIKQADYFVDEQDISRESNWMTKEIQYDITEENLVIEDQKLKFLIHTPHLELERYSESAIPIEFIKVTVDHEKRWI